MGTPGTRHIEQKFYPPGSWDRFFFFVFKPAAFLLNRLRMSNKGSSRNMSSRYRKFSAHTAAFDLHCHKIGPLNHDREHHKILVHQVRALHASKMIQDPNSQKARAHFSCGPTSLINHNQKREGFGFLASCFFFNFSCYGDILDVHWSKSGSWQCQNRATILP